MRVIQIMQLIQSGKIGVVRPKPDYSYPLIRLPTEYADIINEHYLIYATQSEGRKAFLIVFSEIPAELEDNKESKSCITTDQNTLESMNDTLREIKELLAQNLKSERKNEEDTLWAQPDSNRRPPPCKGGVITN